MLWFSDEKKKTFTNKILEAAEFYRNKYKVDPTICYVNPDDLALHEGKQARIGGLLVKPMKVIVKDHFWLGVETDK